MNNGLPPVPQHIVIASDSTDPASTVYVGPFLHLAQADAWHSSAYNTMRTVTLTDPRDT